MVNCFRIKEYVFPATEVNSSDYNAAGSLLTLYSHAINGEILRVQASCSYAGSLTIVESGARITNAILSAATIASGTGLVNSYPYTCTTGSFVVNAPLMMLVSGTASGTGVKIGPVSVYYR